MILYHLLTLALEAVIVGIPISPVSALLPLVPTGSLGLPTTNPLRVPGGGGGVYGAGFTRLGVLPLLAAGLATPRLGQPLGSEERGLAFRKGEIRTTVRANDHFI